MAFYKDDLRCVTRNFDKTLAPTVTLPEDAASKEKRSFANCEPCNKGQTYKSPRKAAEHLHDVHFHCEAAKHKDRLHDDPCMVWIKEATAKDEPDQGRAVLREARDFVEHLSSVSEMISEIQWLVATSVNGVRTQTTRPRLPSSLVHAFETLLSYYVCTAKQLSLLNRSRNPKLAVRLHDARRSLRKIRSEVMDLLDKAKKDVLLEGTTDIFEDTLGLQAVGAEFLFAAVIALIQNRNITIPGESSVQTNTQSNMEVVDMYSRYNNQIHFEANRRPQKRVFTVIHELQEELQALGKIFGRQQTLLRWYMDTVKPQTSDLAYKARKTPFLFEKKYMEDQCDILEEREKQIDMIQSSATALKLHVSQMIEILEEDHGKAIRVFTVVTLFFLPL